MNRITGTETLKEHLGEYLLAICGEDGTRHAVIGELQAEGEKLALKGIRLGQAGPQARQAIRIGGERYRLTKADHIYPISPSLQDGIEIYSFPKETDGRDILTRIQKGITLGTITIA